MSGTENENYHTPKQTPSVTERRRRRRDSAIPGTSNSPIVINVGMGDDEKDVEIEKLNSIVKQQAEMIRDFQKSQQDKMNESKLIDTSNKISEQVENIHEHEITLIASALEETREQLSKSKDSLAASEAAKRKSEQTNERLKTRLKEKEEEIESLNQDKTRLKKQVTSLRDQEEVYISRLEESRRKSETALFEMEAKMQMAETDLKQEKRRSSDLEERIAELNEKLRKMEMKVMEETASASTELTPTMPVVTSPESPRKMNQLARRVSIVNIVQHSNYTQSIEEAHQRIGALSVQCGYHQRDNQQLKKELDESECRAESARMDLASLQLRMTQSEWNADQAHKYLYEEHEKTKHQKAELRGELLKVQRECAVLKQQLEMKSSMSSEEGESLKREVRRVKEESERLKEEVEKLKKEKEREESAVQQMTSKALEAEKRVGELEEKLLSLYLFLVFFLNSLLLESELEARIEKMMRTNRHLNDAMQILDEQAEELMEKKQKAEERMRKAEFDLSSMGDQLQSAQDATASKASDYVEVVAERDRLRTKVHFLNEELKETHTDYKEELASLARQICEKKKEESKEETVTAQLSLMKSEKARLENDVRNEKRRIESLQSEVKALERQINELRESEKRLQDENCKLRQGLAGSVLKIEQYKRASGTAVEELETVKEQMKKEKEKAQQMEEEICILEDTIKEKERLAAYLQSQTNAKQMPKVSRKSTLLRQPSMESCMTGEITLVDERELLELENKKQELFRKLEMKKHELSGRKEEASSTCSSSSSSMVVVPQSSSSSSNRLPLVPLAMNRQTTVGTMRHDIPHRWKAQLGFGVRQLKCAACFDGIPRVRYAQRCLECGVVVHSECANRVENTCGMPEKCATFYLDTHSTPSSAMNGWLRVYIDDGTPSRKWESAWARLDGVSLALFDNDCLAENDGRPLMEMDLANNSWTMRAVADAPNAEREGLNCIHLQMNGRSLYLHAQTANSRGRWIEALKTVQRARIEAVRRPSQSLAASSMLFGLEAPANLNINASYCMDDWILIGCQEGLFVTSLSNPRAPFAVAGITAIAALEGAPDIGMLIAVCGPLRTLALLSFNQLRAEVAVRQPTARPHILTQFDHIHLIMYTKVGSERFLAACNSTEINILRYNERLDSFVPHHTLSTTEPAMCLTPWQSGFFFGSDSFYSVNLVESSVRVKSLAPSHLADFPIAVLPISDRELLLAYQNHGRFVSPDGILTRNEQIEWEQMPLEFCYIAPHLYLVSMNSLEILSVLPYSSPSTPAFAPEKEYVRMNGTGAHIVGRRLNGDVHLALTTPSITELHSINAAQVDKKKKRKSLAPSRPLVVHPLPDQITVECIGRPTFTSTPRASRVDVTVTVEKEKAAKRSVKRKGSATVADKRSKIG
ncbi:hypothetical protein PFISCL1PPCAC_10037, partial [Pristionchus fissidentatus]